MSIGEKTTFWNLMNTTELSGIEIPRIQRDYVQGRNTAQVRYARRRMIDEIYDSINDDKTIDLNFVYGKDEDGIFIPIDGQQRLTTLLSLHIYAFSKNSDFEGLSILNKKFRYLTRTSTSRFLTALIEDLPNYFLLSEQPDIVTYIEDSAWYFSEWDKDPSVNSFKVVLNDINKKFADFPELHNRLKSTDCPITFMALKITDIGQVNDLYIKMNSRGKPLTEFESFKSELFDFLEQCNSDIISFDVDDFKKKADGDWLSMIWDICENPAKECDDIYMAFLHQIIVNRLVPGKYGDNSSDDWNELIENDGFFNFSNYKPFLKDGKAICDIFYTFTLCMYILNNDPENSLIKSLVKEPSLNYYTQVRVATLTQYAISVSEMDWNISNLKDWLRITNNLINNTPIDKTERYIYACNSIWNTATDMVHDTNNYLSNASDEQISSISFFDNRQKTEEVLKCKLFTADNNWQPLILEAEQHAYFNGEIRFVFSLCELLEYSDALHHSELQNKFKTIWSLIKIIFPKDKKPTLSVDENLFKRALLTYGDYSILAGSSYCYYFEDNKGYYNWRRLLRDNNLKSFEIFKAMLCDMLNSQIKTPDDIITFLDSAINNYSDTSDMITYHIIKMPEIMESMRYNRFKRCEDDTENHRHIFYMFSTLGDRYAEAYSYFVYHKLDLEKEYHYGKGYLNTDTTYAYIEKVNGIPCYITYNYDIKAFCDESKNPYLNDTGTPIQSVDEMVTWIKTNLK